MSTAGFTYDNSGNLTANATGPTFSYDLENFMLTVGSKPQKLGIQAVKFLGLTFTRCRLKIMGALLPRSLAQVARAGFILYEEVQRPGSGKAGATPGSRVS